MLGLTTGKNGLLQNKINILITGNKHIYQHMEGGGSRRKNRKTGSGDSSALDNDIIWPALCSMGTYTMNIHHSILVLGVALT